MALTLAQADLLTVDNLKRGIVETIIDEFGGLNLLPFESVVGKSFAYDRESTLPDAEFRNVNEVISESSPVPTQVTVTLKRIIGDHDLDKFLRATKSNYQDLDAYYVQQATKACVRKFKDALIYGDSSSNAKEFDGWHALVDSSMMVHASADANGAPLSLSKLDQMLDLMKGGYDAIFMNRTIRRRMSQALRATGVSGYTLNERDDFGRWIDVYNGHPVYVVDFITQTEALTAGGVYSAKTGGTTSSIFAVKFGDVVEGGFMGLQGTDGPEVEVIDPVPNKDAIRYRVKWYVAAALGRVLSLARLDGITDAAVTA
jgi:hypothetical protein